MELYPHQKAAIADLANAYREGHRRPMLQAVTGFGKTEVAAAMSIGTIAKNPRARILFGVPDLSLVDQARDRFLLRGVTTPDNLSVIQGDHPDYNPSASVMVASLPTLGARGWPENLNLVFIDEAHVRAEHVHKWMASEAAAKTLVIGLSATPWSKGLGKHYTRLVKGASMTELREAGFLSGFRVVAPPFAQPDLKGVRTVLGDYKESDLEERCAKPQLVADVVATWLEKGQNRPTLVFAVNRMHAKLLHQQFESCGVPAGYIDAHTEREDRLAQFGALREGVIKVIVNVACLTRGFDLPAVSCIVLARPTKSRMLFAQIIGRGLRPAPGKDLCLILDHSRTHETLGFVDELDIDELDDGKEGKGEAKKSKKEDKTPLPKCCPNDACATMNPAHVRQCIACGTVFPISTVVNVDETGHLVEITRDGKSKPKGDQTSVGNRIRAMGKQSVWSQLLGDYQGQVRKSLGFYENAYREIFGVWPRGLVDRAERPSPEVCGYIRHKLIRFAKSNGSYSMGAGHAY